MWLISLLACPSQASVSSSWSLVAAAAFQLGQLWPTGDPLIGYEQFANS